jgi:hypothetical protein
MEVLAVNQLEDGTHRTDASMALVDREVFIRTPRNLYCIAAP